MSSDIERLAHIEQLVNGATVTASLDPNKAITLTITCFGELQSIELTDEGRRMSPDALVKAIVHIQQAACRLARDNIEKLVDEIPSTAMIPDQPQAQRSSPSRVKIFDRPK